MVCTLWQLWAYRTTGRKPTEETLSFMVYRTDPLAPTEIGIPTLRVAKTKYLSNNQNLDKKKFLDEWRHRALIGHEACARRISRHFNKRVSLKEFLFGDLVLLQAFLKPHGNSKLDPNWEALQNSFQEHRWCIFTSNFGWTNNGHT